MTMKSVLLDFDGTLVDSSKGIFNAFFKACHSVGEIAPNIDSFRQLIGPPINRIAENMFPNMSKSRLAELLKVFRNEYDSIDYTFVDWHSGVLESIKEAAHKYHTQLYVVTNKPTKPTMLIIEQAGLSSCFKGIVGIDYRVVKNSESPFSDKTEAINFTLSLAKTKPEDTVYIGDTPADLRSALQCGVTFIAATYGFHPWSADELEGVPAADCFKVAMSIIDSLEQ